MHPDILLSIFLLSGLALVLHHIADFNKRIGAAPRSIRGMLYSFILMLLTLIPLCAIIFYSFGDTAFEIPIATEAVKESRQEFWLTLPPNCYWSALVFYDDKRSPATRNLNEARETFYFEYRIFINDKLTEHGGKHFSYADNDHPFYDNIPVRSSRDVIHVILALKADQENSDLPRIGYVIQTVNEGKFFTRGYEISP